MNVTRDPQNHNNLPPKIPGRSCPPSPSIAQQLRTPTCERSTEGLAHPRRYSEVGHSVPQRVLDPRLASEGEGHNAHRPERRKKFKFKDKLLPTTPTSRTPPPGKLKKLTYIKSSNT